MFSKNLKYYRLKNNMSMKELASSIGVTPMTISYYESGERRPGMADAATSNLGMISVVSLLVYWIFIFHFESFL